MGNAMVENPVTVLAGVSNVEASRLDAIARRKKHQADVELLGRLDGSLEVLERLRTVVVGQNRSR